MEEKLTINWIINTLKKSGVNSKQIVINRLQLASNDDLITLSNSCLDRLFYLEVKNLVMPPITKSKKKINEKE